MANYEYIDFSKNSQQSWWEQWRSSILDWRVMQNGLLIGVVARHPATLAFLFGFTAFFSSPLGYFITAAVGICLIIDLAYALTNNFANHYKKSRYHQLAIAPNTPIKKFEQAHPWKAWLAGWLQWVNLIRFPFRAIAAALALAIIITGSTTLSAAAVILSIFAGLVISIPVSMYAESRHEDNRNTLAKLKEEAENIITRQDTELKDASLYPVKEESLYWRAFNPGDFALGVLLSGAIARRAFMPMTIGKEQWLTNTSAALGQLSPMGLILIILAVGWVLDLLYSFARNIKTHYALDEQRKINDNLRNFQKDEQPLPRFSAAYPVWAKIESSLSFMNILRFSFRAISVTVALLIATGALGSLAVDNTFFSFFDGYASEEDAATMTQLLRVVVIMSIVGFFLGYMSERSDKLQQQEVESARTGYLVAVAENKQAKRPGVGQGPAPGLRTDVNDVGKVKSIGKGGTTLIFSGGAGEGLGDCEDDPFTKTAGRANPLYVPQGPG